MTFIRRALVLLVIANCVIDVQFAFAQQDSVKKYTTAFLVGEPPKIDGVLNESAWEQVPWGGGNFRQKMPDAGKPASVQTKFKILYDSKNLYIAFLCLDPEPDKIVKRMSRRDGFEGDWVEINIDSYNDKRTAFSFTSSVSGVKGDEYVSDNGNNWDASWDPIWYLKTSINNEGWIAELRIPLSQLRFADKPDLIFGFQIQRYLFRNQEISNFQYIPPDAPGWVHLFAELHDIKNIKPQKQLEIQPYVLAKTESFQKEEDNPYATGRSSSVDFGLDAKVGITSDITLDLTVNPDFGQVEADPSQVNLTAFELFFEERRPFFIEGRNTLNFPLSPQGNTNLFYSRRIGRRPQGQVITDGIDDGVAEFAKVSPQTTILGAAKLTGKNKKGFSWGILETVTDKETASIDSLSIVRKVTVEPMTNYFVARAQQDINKGNTIVGGMLTATNRNNSEAHLDWLHTQAYSGGLDFLHNWKERTYYISAKGMISNVRGSTHAITTTQRSSERYFQRPDKSHSKVDTTRTSLTGTGGTLIIGKQSGKLVADVGFTWQSPELELNDIGFLSQTDQLSQWLWMQYRVLNPVGLFRSQRYNINQFMDWDFGRRNTNRGYNFNGHVEFKNFWQLSMGTSYTTHFISNADLRGGPAIRYPGNFTYWFAASTDRRKKLQLSINPEWQWGNQSYSNSTTLDLEINYRPINAFNISISPNISHQKNALQYVSTPTYGSSDRYVVAQIDQSTFRVSIRATFMITPNLSVQYYGQPFGTAGRYTNFKYITEANAEAYTDRFNSIPESSLSTTDNNNLSVDENQDGNMDYSFVKPDFNFSQFRSNMVMRWEYIPGSTFFLVWSQEMNGAFYDQQGAVHKRYNFSFSDKPHNILLLKYTYRFML